jgi:hypothetical protein
MNRPAPAKQQQSSVERGEIPRNPPRGGRALLADWVTTMAPGRGN